MKKKYSAKSQVSVTVIYRNGARKHISFCAKTNGGSMYYSSDADEQYALEHHPKFGRLYKLERVIEGPSATEEPRGGNAVKPAAKKADKKGPVEITVTDLSSAKEYLCDKFGISRTKLRSAAAIIEAGRQNGIVFKGI